jgi:hypothetical protein
VSLMRREVFVEMPMLLSMLLFLIIVMYFYKCN